jgi:hypothetical protein
MDTVYQHDSANTQNDLRSTSLSLKILQSGTTSTDLGGMLSLGNDDTNNDSLLQNLDLLLQLGLDLVDKLGITTKSDFIRGSISAFPWESDETGLLE